MPIQTAYWLTRSKNRVDHLLRKNSGKQSSDRAARAMHPESIQRVIIPEESLHLRHHPIAHRPGNNADCQRRHRPHKTGSRSDRHQPRNCAGNRAQRAGAPVLDPRSEEHTSELQSQSNLVCRLLLEKKKQTTLPLLTQSPTCRERNWLDLLVPERVRFSPTHPPPRAVYRSDSDRSYATSESHARLAT